MRTDIRLRQCTALITGLLLTTGVNAQADSSLDGWPDWVKEAMETEIRKTKLRKVKVPTDAISTKLPGKPEPAQAIDNGWYFVSDIKAGSPLECYIYTTALDLATLTNLLAENNMTAVAQASGGIIDARQPYSVDAGVVEGLPYLALEWLYTITSESQTLVGFTKVRVAVKGDTAFACTHNYLGYRETFARSFSDFIENTEYEDTSSRPYYEEITHLEYNRIGAGIAYFSLTEDEEGDIKAFTAEASIIPVDTNTVMANDSLTIAYSTPDGEMINAVSVVVENGEITSNLSLQRNDEDAWVSEGTLQNKEITTEIDGALSPATTLQSITAARDLFLSEETSVTQNIWVPALDPTRFIEMTLTRDDAETEGQAKVSLGPLSYVGQFDEHGNLIRSKMSMGPMTINTELIWSEGTWTK